MSTQACCNEGIVNGTLEADFVIIGSGSAGSALAYRLSEDGKHSVIVIEYGGSDYGPLIQMPSALSIPLNMSYYDWGFSTEPEPHLGGRTLATPRGKVLGGSSSINGMVYVRGHARDFDHWAEEGAAGWAFADVLPYFARMEHATAARMAGGARKVRCACNAAAARIRSMPPLSKRDSRPDSKPPTITTAPSRKALGPWSRPSSTAAAGLPRTPICALP
jgi:choline dehydrogenase-like flavoprotein